MNLWKINQGLLPSGDLGGPSLEDEEEEEDGGGEGEEERSVGGGSHPATGRNHAEAEVFISTTQPPSSLSTLSVRNIQ